MVVSEKLGEVKSSSGKLVEVKKTFMTTNPVLFDGLFIPGGKDLSTALSRNPKALHFIQETFRHNKPMAFAGESLDLAALTHLKDMLDLKEISKQSNFSQQGFIFKGANGDLKKFADEFIKALAQHRHWDRKGETLPG